MHNPTEELAIADQVIWQLSGLHCPSCAQNIESSIKKLEGVKDATVNYVTSQLIVSFNRDQISGERIKKIVHNLGYTIKDEESQTMEQLLQIKGMHCPSCAQNIESSIKKAGGIKDAAVNYVTGKALVRFDKRQINIDQIKKIISDLGYKVKEKDKLNTNIFMEKYLPILQVVLSGLFLLLSWIASYNGWEIKSLPGDWGKLDSLFAILAIAIGWTNILITAVKTLISFNLNVDVLVSIAVITSIFIGSYKEAATVIFIVLLGEFLEGFTVSMTRNSIKKLIEIMPKKAMVKRDGETIEIPVHEVAVEDIVIVKPGEQVPVDGKLTTSDTISVNEAALTGESLPAEKKTGDKILAGSISDGCYFEIEATAIGENTTLGKIKQLVEDAQNKKANIQRLTDRFAKYFIPAVFIMAVIVGVITYDITKVVTILIAACPCALVIATPVAIVAGIGRGASRGILIKGGEYLENIAFTDTVVFDKTGTLTVGSPKITDIKGFNDHSDAEIVKMAASLEIRSEHHIALAILKKAQELNLEIKKDANNTRIIKGKGIIGYYDGLKVYVGNMDLMNENDIKISSLVSEHVDKKQNEGKTVILVAHESTICGVITISDELREDAKKSIQMIKNLGIKNIWLLTGDNEVVAANIANELNIPDYLGKMLPQDKIAHIKKLQTQGEKVVMIGDGINDAPALVAADTGIAMGKAGTDIAIESADIALMKDDLLKIPEIIQLGRKTVDIIKQNITFALTYNVFIISLASVGAIHMIHGAIFHQISSLFVILNAMRILAYKSK